MSTTVTLGFATVLTVISLLLVALSFSTDYWVSNYVDDTDGALSRATISTDQDRLRTHYSRHSGMLKECFDSPNISNVIEDAKSNWLDGNCLKIEYQIPETPGSNKYSDDYWTMIHLMRAQFAFFITAMLFLLAGAFFGSTGCWRTTARPSRVAGILIFLAAFFVAAAMAFFHGAEYIEKNKIDTLDPVYLYRNWEHDVKVATTRKYSWSYILGWVGVGTAAVAGTIFLFAGWYISERKREDVLEQYSVRSRPRIEYVEPTVYPVKEDYYFMNGKPMYDRGYIGPYDRAGTWDYRY